MFENSYFESGRWTPDGKILLFLFLFWLQGTFDTFLCVDAWGRCIVSSWTSFAYLPHLNQAVFVVGGMHTLPSWLVHDGDASFLVGHLLPASVTSPVANLTGDDTHFPSNWCIRQEHLFFCWTPFACLCHGAFMKFWLVGRLWRFPQGWLQVFFSLFFCVTGELFTLDGKAGHVMTHVCHCARQEQRRTIAGLDFTLALGWSIWARRQIFNLISLFSSMKCFKRLS